MKDSYEASLPVTPEILFFWQHTAELAITIIWSSWYEMEIRHNRKLENREELFSVRPNDSLSYHDTKEKINHLIDLINEINPNTDLVKNIYSFLKDGGFRRLCYWIANEDNEVQGEVSKITALKKSLKNTLGEVYPVLSKTQPELFPLIKIFSDRKHKDLEKEKQEQSLYKVGVAFGSPKQSNTNLFCDDPRGGY